MADPFSILAGTFGVLDVCVKVVKYLGDISRASNSIDDDLQAVSKEIEALESTIKAVAAAQKNCTIDGGAPSDILQSIPADVCSVWRETGHLLQQCKSTVEGLGVLLGSVVGTKLTQGKISGLVKALRMNSKEKEFAQIRQRLGILQQTLTTNVSLLNMLYNQVSFEQVSTNIRRIHENIQRLKFNADVAGYSGADNSLDSMRQLMAHATRNKHFDIPVAVSSIFTGRTAFLHVVRGSLLDEAPLVNQRVQKRFVIYGIGGSGKTAFCCKFAQEFRENFWGIFFVDASSDLSAKQSFATIAKIGGAEPNERAAKHWLSNLEHPWLLIVDSADDPALSMEKYFPEGDRGSLLITTRNPDFRIHGTVGAKALEFTPMEHDEADDLLLKAASKPSPWAVQTRNAARRISSALGFLPLALIHAGKAIISHVCTLENYLEFFHKSWERVRAHRKSRRLGDDDEYLAIYSSYEIIYRGLELKDSESSIQAVELLKLFSFLHHENIQVDILRKAAATPENERRESEARKNDQDHVQVEVRRKSWSKHLSHAFFAARALYQRYTDTSGRVVPSIFLESEEFDFKVAEALKELNQLSLISYHQTSDSYTMHALVHKWVRERPGMSTSDQAIWCQAALNVVSRSVSVMPDDSTNDAAYRMCLLPHVQNVLSHRTALAHRYATARKLQKYWHPFGSSSRFTPNEASCMVRCSRVYAECGRWEDAERLQLPVKDYLCWMLGMAHEISRRITLFLSETYWQLGRGKEAASLQTDVVKASIENLGKTHPDTLKAMSHLGNSFWMLGKFKEAMHLHQQAAEGMSKTFGEDHPDTLRCKGYIGRIHSKYLRFAEAKELHTATVNGLKVALGEEHLDTLTAMDDLATSFLDAWHINNDEPLDEAQTLMTEVMEKRKLKLGREHPYTLWAIANLARVKSALNKHVESEYLFKQGLLVAKRNLGDDHIGTLFGRMHYGQNLTRQKRFKEAEIEFIDIIQRHERMASARNGQHPDRVFAMMLLVECYKTQGRIDEAITWCENALDGLRALGGRNHPFETIIVNQYNNLQDSRGSTSAPFAQSAVSTAVECISNADEPTAVNSFRYGGGGSRRVLTF